MHSTESDFSLATVVWEAALRLINKHGMPTPTQPIDGEIRTCRIDDLHISQTITRIFEPAGEAIQLEVWTQQGSERLHVFSEGWDTLDEELMVHEFIPGDWVSRLLAMADSPINLQADLLWGNQADAIRILPSGSPTAEQLPQTPFTVCNAIGTLGKSSLMIEAYSRLLGTRSD